MAITQAAAQNREVQVGPSHGEEERIDGKGVRFQGVKEPSALPGIVLNVESGGHGDEDVLQVRAAPPGIPPGMPRPERRESGRPGSA